MDELSLEQSIGLLLSQVPKPIQDFVLNKLSAKTQKLADKHQLHVDQAGVLQRDLLLMLLGKQEPADFSRSLVEAGIPEATAQSLLLDINEEIFKPLRKLEQSPESQVTAPVINSPAYREPIPEPSPVTPVAPVEHTPPTPPPPPPPVWQPPYPQTAPPPPQFVPMPPGTYWVPVSIAQVPPPQTPQPVAPAAPLPTPEPSPTSTPEPAPAPTEPTPAPRPQWTPPVNLPTGMPPVPPPPQIPITKEYGADPYREPV